MDEFGSFLLEHATGSGAQVGLREAAGIAKASDAHVTVQTVLSDEAHPAQVLAARLGIEPVGLIGSAAVLVLADRDEETAVSVWPAGPDDVWHIVATVPATHHQWERLQRRISSAAPYLSTFSLEESDFRRVGEKLSRFGRVEVSRYTGRRPHDLSSVHLGWSLRRNEVRPTYADVLDREAADAWVRTMTLHVDDALSLHLRREAGATFYSGDFALFDSVVLRRLAEAGAERRALLSGRSRRDPVPAAPVLVKMPGAIFDDPEQVSRLVDVIGSHSHAGYAVLHRNPYLHLSITDYLDGSNFDAFITSDDEVIIHPGYKATLGSLTRLTEWLTENFAALGVTEGASVNSATRDELLTSG